MKKVVIIYWSKTGNTQKAAKAIESGMRNAGAHVELLRPEEARNIHWYDYDLICVGFPSYHFHPPSGMVDYLHMKFNEYHREDRVKIGAPKIPGKNVLVFCTYAGPHTGIREAIPPVKYVGQFFEHLGFTVLDEWYIVGEWHGSQEKSTIGPLGDTRGRPNAQDLEKIKRDAESFFLRLGDSAK